MKKNLIIFLLFTLNLSHAQTAFLATAHEQDWESEYFKQLEDLSVPVHTNQLIFKWKEEDKKEISVVSNWIKQLSEFNSKTVYIDLAGHSWPGTEKMDYKSSGLVLPTNFYQKIKVYRYEAMLQDIKNNIENDKNLILISDTCYGGGVHYLAEKRKRTCAFSSTDHRTLSAKNKHITDTRSSTLIWENLKMGKSLFQSYFEILKDDNLNGGRGLISSKFIIHKKLGKNSFDKSYNDRLFSKQNIAQTLLPIAKMPLPFIRKQKSRFNWSSKRNEIYELVESDLEKSKSNINQLITNISKNRELLAEFIDQRLEELLQNSLDYYNRNEAIHTNKDITKYFFVFEYYADLIDYLKIANRDEKEYLRNVQDCEASTL